MSDTWTTGDTILVWGTVLGGITFMAVSFVFIFMEDHPQKRGWAVAAMLWPITLIILSPVLLVKATAITFKRRGLVASWSNVITDTYKKAVK